GLDRVEHRKVGVGAKLQARWVRDRHHEAVARKPSDRRILANRHPACREAAEMASPRGEGHSAASLVRSDDDGRKLWPEQQTGKEERVKLRIRPGRRKDDVDL